MNEVIVIDDSRCTGCGLCVKDCANRAIVLRDNKAVVKHTCMACGHCVAICPAAAVSIPEYDMDGVEAYDQASFEISPVNFLHAVKFRRSIRSYSKQPLESAVLERIMQAGRYTPTAKNLQACTFVAVSERFLEFKRMFWAEFPSILKTIEEKRPEYAKPFTKIYERWKKDPENDVFFFNAPCLLITAADHPLDGGLAAANMENMAVAAGAGVLYSGYLQGTISVSPVLLEWLGLKGRTIACCMLLGYPAVRYQRTAPRRKGDIRIL